MVQTISEIESELKNNVQVDKGAYPPKLTEIQRERLDYYRVRVTVKYCSDKDAFRIVYFLGDIYLGTEVSDDSLENLCSDIKKEIIHVL